MNILNSLLTNHKATAVSFLGGVALFLMDGQAVAELTALGLPGTTSQRLVSAAKLTLLALSYLGYSPVKKAA